MVTMKWDDFDTELANASAAVAGGFLKRELCLYAQKQNQSSEMVSGRVCLYMFLRRYVMDGGQVLHVDYCPHAPRDEIGSGGVVGRSGPDLARNGAKP